MAQLTKENEDTLRLICNGGTITPKEFTDLIYTIIPRILRDLDYGYAHPDRPLKDVLPYQEPYIPFSTKDRK